jgi:hypothetical protein
VLRAAVPETSIDEDGDPGTEKSDIRPALHARNYLAVDAITQPQPMQLPA